MRLLLTKPVVKALKLKVFTPGNKGGFVRTVRAPKGRRFTEDGIEGVLVQMAGEIEKQWPNEEYSLVPIGAGAFNFVWRSTKVPEPAAAADLGKV